MRRRRLPARGGETDGRGESRDHQRLGKCCCEAHLDASFVCCSVELSAGHFDLLAERGWVPKRGARTRRRRSDSGTLGGEDSTFAARGGRLNNDCRSPDCQI